MDFPGGERREEVDFLPNTWVFFVFQRSNYFDPIVINQGYELAQPEDVYNLLGSQIISDEQNVKTKMPVVHQSISAKCGAQFVFKYSALAPKELKKMESISKSLLRSVLTSNDIHKLSHVLKGILHK